MTTGHFIFRYSRPYEGTLARNIGAPLTENDFLLGKSKAEAANLIWQEHETRILSLFSEMYKINIPETGRTIYLSQILDGSFSDPMTISIKRFVDIENNLESPKRLVFVTIHELAHYFMFNRSGDTFANKLFERVKGQKIGGDRGTDLHYLVQAVEFGIGGEIYGEDCAKSKRDFKVKNSHGEYQKAAQLLIDHKVPLDKTCLEFIDKEILKD